MMGFRLLHEQRDLLQYINYTEAHLGVRFPLEYLRQGRVMGFFDKNHKLAGGYSLILKGPFRVLESLPETIKTAHPILSKIKESSICEITGLWLSPELKYNNTSLHLWLRFYRNILFLRKKYFVYAYTFGKRSLGRLYSNMRPYIIFQGKTKLLPGMHQPEFESVELTTWGRIITVPIRKPRLLFGKMAGERTLASNASFMKMLHTNLMNLK